MTGEPEEFELVFPFVACRSKGGHHEDEPFAAGFECGSIDARLAYEQPGRLTLTVRRDSLAQLDLIAMRRGYTATEDELGPDWADDWAQVTFSRTGGHEVQVSA
jgi:hypothetical protein